MSDLVKRLPGAPVPCHVMRRQYLAEVSAAIALADAKHGEGETK